ncbi:SGNH/GDSL hydrolase family protein [Arenibaculum pallidiluteum]|uniref:SGNH/GDSL hydrolase family protein n=1 Tax=Arenibaculum pallidiluteum TaxID=2812559 RepID=UPI001A96C1B6|nr:SGNH/GDSL hydrolase family protein [Arenibaculum pallidiluteum]
MARIVLLGDSIFDNAAYVAGGPDVVAQLNAVLPPGSSAELRAVDGAVVSGVARQALGLPAGTSHLVVSAGGNDALGQAPVLQDRAGSVAEVVERLARIRDGFARNYRAMLDAVLAHGIPTALCTIYDARFPDPAYQRLVVTALGIFNDVILREAFARGLSVIDLRLICDEDADYANPIEPSTHGGAKIAAAIAALSTEQPVARGRPTVFAR